MDASVMNNKRCVSQTHILTDENEVSGCTINIMLIHIVLKKQMFYFIVLQFDGRQVSSEKRNN